MTLRLNAHVEAGLVSLFSCSPVRPLFLLSLGPEGRGALVPPVQGTQ